MSLVIRVVVFTIVALLAAVFIAQIPAYILDDLKHSQRFVNGLAPATVGYAIIACIKSWRPAYNRLAAIYTLIWPFVGISALFVAEAVLALQPPTNFENASFRLALIAGSVQAGHPFVSLMILWQHATFPRGSSETSPPADKRNGLGQILAFFSDGPSPNTSRQKDDLREGDQLDRASSDKFELLIKYSDVIKGQYDRVQVLPPRFADAFKKRIAASENPKADAGAIADVLVAEHEKELAPYDDPIANQRLGELRARGGDKAAKAFRDAMSAFGADADSEAIFQKIIYEVDPPLEVVLVSTAVAAALVTIGTYTGSVLGVLANLAISGPLPHPEWANTPITYALYYGVIPHGTSQHASDLAFSVGALGGAAIAVFVHRRWAKTQRLPKRSSK